jgi:hypothetical protein
MDRPAIKLIFRKFDINKMAENNKIILYILITVAIVAMIIFVTNYFKKKAIIRRKLKKAVTKSISSFLDGEFAKIVGKVELTGTPLNAPLSGRPCAYYSVLVEQKVSSGKSSHWKTLIEEEVAGPFGIRDGMSCARVEAEWMASYIVPDRKYTTGFMEDATEKLSSYLKQHGHESENFMGLNKTLRFREGILEEGEKISVLGKGKWERADTGQWSDDYGKVLVFRSAKEALVYLSDDPETVG